MADDESELTEITIYPDGRIFVFGMSGPMLEILIALEPNNQRLQKLHEQTRHASGQVVSQNEN